MATLIKNIHIGNTSGAHRMNPMLSKSKTPNRSRATAFWRTSR